MILMGWTLDQWACVAGWFEATHQWLPLPSMRSAWELAHAWHELRGDAPGPIIMRAEGRYSYQEILMHDEELPALDNPISLRNMGYALRLFRQCAMTVYAPAR